PADPPTSAPPPPPPTARPPSPPLPPDAGPPLAPPSPPFVVFDEGPSSLPHASGVTSAAANTTGQEHARMVRNWVLRSSIPRILATPWRLAPWPSQCPEATNRVQETGGGEKLARSVQRRPWVSGPLRNARH